MISFRFDIESQRNFRLKNEKFYSFISKHIKANAVLEKNRFLKQHVNALEMYICAGSRILRVKKGPNPGSGKLIRRVWFLWFCAYLTMPVCCG
jgi:hypothetical protein